MGLRAMVQQYQERRELKGYQKEWEGLVPGDVVEYKGQRYRYLGIDKDVVLTRRAGYQEPIFGTDKPTVPDKVWYIRTKRELRTEGVSVFILPDVMRKLIMKESAQAGDITIGSLLYTSRDDLTKVGHITPDEWRVMVEKLKKELAGAK